jgi:16S rRNA (guanine966-N2)-methyltransferase
MQIGLIKIQGGFANGLGILSPQGLGTRPTAAKIRAAIWNTLQAEVVDARIADLFAGSGAVGLSGLSLGARSCVFFENGKTVVPILQQNVQGIEDAANKDNRQIVTQVVTKSIYQIDPGRDGYGPFDIVFIDPPYEKTRDFVSNIVEKWVPMVALSGKIVLETDSQFSVDEIDLGASGIKVTREKSYGSSKVLHWERVT